MNYPPISPNESMRLRTGWIVTTIRLGVLSDSERVNLQREALGRRRSLLQSVDLDQLERELQRLLGAGDGSANRTHQRYSRRSDLYGLFEIMERELLRRVGLSFPAREGVLALLSSVRYELLIRFPSWSPRQWWNL